MTPILILAAGASSRMGGSDKLLRPIDGVPFLVRTVRRARATGHPVLVAIPGPWHPRYHALKDENVVCFDVPDSQEGIGGTLRGAVKRLPPCDAFMIMLADMPMLDTADIAKLFNERKTNPSALILRASTEDGKPGHPVVFDAQLRDEFKNCEGDEGAKVVLSAHKQDTRLIHLSGQRARYDLDTPEDWVDWENRTESALSG